MAQADFTSSFTRFDDDDEIQCACSADESLPWLVSNCDRLKREGRFEAVLIYMLAQGRSGFAYRPEDIDAWRQLFWEMDLEKSRVMGCPLPTFNAMTLYRGVAADQRHATPGFFWSTGLRTALHYAGWPCPTGSAMFVFRAVVPANEIALYVDRHSGRFIEVVAAPIECELLTFPKDFAIFNRDYGFPTIEERRLAIVRRNRREREQAIGAQKRAMNARIRAAQLQAAIDNPAVTRQEIFCRFGVLVSK